LKLDIKQLTVCYRDNDHLLMALDRVRLTLEPGRITALVGESGSGKTTLGKALMGLLPGNADIAGQILFDHTSLLELDDAQINALRGSRIAMVFQNSTSNFNPVYRLVDQVAEPLIQQQGMAPGPARKKALDLMMEMGLHADQADRFPHELSGGQIQRALLAMALILDPDILILDEPTAALDAMTKNFISGVIQKLRLAKKSILLITHDLDLARNLADDTAVLYLGRIMEYLPGSSLFFPKHPYTLGLARSYPGMGAVRDLGGIRGAAFYRLVHTHPHDRAPAHVHVVADGPVHEDGHAPQEGCLFRPRCTQAVDACRHGDMPLLKTDAHRVRCIRGGIAELLCLQKTSRSYGTVRALHPTDLTLMAGEVFCLVGETGSGKTTLAMIAAGALAPDTGTRTFDGKDIAAWIKKDPLSLRSRIGVIYQNPAEAVSHRFTVFEAVAEPLGIQKKDLSKEEIRQRVAAALADVRLPALPEFLKRYPHELNMGAVQRVCIARALIHDPLLLVADEPTSALDPSVQAKVLKMLLNLQIEKGLTLLLITHDIGLARKIADRIGVMLAGRMVETGPASDIINHPGHPYTRMLVNSAKNQALPSLWNGRAPDNTNAETTGCPFRDRCPYATPDCTGDIQKTTRPGHPHHMVWCANPLNGVGPK
jgi:peptide/nickel transport system ATP-binding protein